MKKNKLGVCAHCGKPAEFEASNPWRPFCCERCKLVDLGAWASSRYSIPLEDTPLEEAAQDEKLQ